MQLSIKHYLFFFFLFSGASVSAQWLEPFSPNLPSENYFYEENTANDFYSQDFFSGMSSDWSNNLYTNIFSLTNFGGPLLGNEDGGGNPAEAENGLPNSGIPLQSGFVLLLISVCFYFLFIFYKRNMKVRLISLFFFLAVFSGKAANINLPAVQYQVLATSSLSLNLGDITGIPAACTSEVPNILIPASKGVATGLEGRVTYKSTLTNPDDIGTDSFVFTVDCNGDTYIITVNLDILPKPDNIDEAPCYKDPEPTVWKIDEIYTDLGETSNYISPLVGDLDGDGLPEIVTVSKHGTHSGSLGNFPHNSQYISVFDGVARARAEFQTEKPFNPYMPGLIAIARIYTNSGYLGIIVVAEADGYLRAYSKASGAWTCRWTSSEKWRDDTIPATGLLASQTSVGFADFNNDGYVEVYASNKIFDAETGVLLCKGSANKGYSRMDESGTSHYALVSTIAADICGDSKLELVAGNQVYQVNIVSRTTPSLNSMSVVKSVSPPSCIEKPSLVILADGASQVVDIDNDGKLDVIVQQWINKTGDFFLYAWSPEKQTVLAQKLFIQSNRMGFPFLGDIDGDGKIEIVVLGSNNYASPTAINNKIYALKYKGNPLLELFWYLEHADTSGNTGLTLFDFNQDGVSELVYRDEQTLRIINGSGIGRDWKNNPATINPITRELTNYELSPPIVCTSGTGWEYPTIADVDNDGQAEIIIAGANSGAVWNGSLRIYKSGGSPWAPARSVWNQYMYNAVNVNEDLTIPRYQLNPATIFAGEDEIQGTADDVRPYNAFLQQQTTINQFGIPFIPAPDLRLSSDLDYSYNGSGDLVITIKVDNVGEATMYLPIPVSIYKESISTPNLLLTESVINNIAPGASETLQLIIAPAAIAGANQLIINLNDPGTGIYPTNDECNTHNNRFVIPLFNDYFGLPYSLPLTAANFDILKNDFEFLNKPMIGLTIDHVSSAAGATVSIPSGAMFSGRQGLIYAPKPGFFGIDVVQYTVSGSGFSSTGTVYIYVFETAGRLCPGSTLYDIAINDTDNDVSVVWLERTFPFDEVESLTITNPSGTQSFLLDVEVIFNVSQSDPIEAFNNKMTTNYTLRIVPPVLYWRPNGDNNWNNPANWLYPDQTAANVVPLKCTDVHISGVANYYPDLSSSNTVRSVFYGEPECKDIYYHFGGETAHPNFLDYDRAFIHYNVGYYDATNTFMTDGDVFSAEPMNRSQWYGLSTPLKKIATGDFCFGGRPHTWQMQFVRNQTNAVWSGEFSKPFSNNGIELNENYAFSYAFWANKYVAGAIGSDKEYQTNLNGLKGIIQMPYYSNASIDAFHTLHSYNSSNQISSFKYYYYTVPGVPETNHVPAGTINRGTNDEAYRFIFDENIVKTSDNKDAFKITVTAGSEIMIGNPFMSSLDFDAFYEANSTKIKPVYRLFEDETFVSYLYGDETQIAVLQSFFIQTEGSFGTSVDLYFPFEDVSITRDITTSHQLKSSSNKTEDNILYVTATNKTSQGKSNSVRLNLLNDNNYRMDENVYQLFYGHSVQTPQIYFEDETQQKNAIQYVDNRSKTAIPLGINLAANANIELSFSNLENLQIESLYLLDKQTGMRQNLFANAYYSFIQSESNAFNDRFVLEVGAYNPTYIDHIQTNDNSINIYQTNENITISSKEKIEKIELFDMKGQKIQQIDNINNTIQPINTDFPAGVYLIKINLINGESQTDKIVIR